MDINLSHLSAQEKDLQLFLESLGVHLPGEDKEVGDEYIVIHLAPDVALLFEANDNKVVVLSYRMQGNVFPLFLAFLKGDEENSILPYDSAP